jgi:hypothetical protein
MHSTKLRMPCCAKVKLCLAVPLIQGKKGGRSEWRLLKGFWAINPLFRLAKLLGFKIIVLSGIDA